MSIVARNVATLEKALTTLETHRVSPDQRLAYYSFALNTVEASAAALDAACKPFGGRVPDAAFLVVGGSYPRFFVEMTEQDLLQGMEMGYCKLKGEHLLNVAVSHALHPRGASFFGSGLRSHSF